MTRFGRALLPYLVAAGTTAIVVAIAFASGAQLPGIVYIIPIVLAAWWGGFAPGVFATALIASISVIVYFSRTEGSDAPFRVAPFVSLITIGIGVSWLFEMLHASHRRLEERQRQLRDSEERLLEADRRKDHFLAVLAHELRNPLAPLSNALQVWPLVENDRFETESLREVMDRQVQQMVRLIDDLLDVSRITRGKVTLQKQPVDVNLVVQSALETTQPLIDACGHQLTVVTPSTPLMVEGDVARLVQVVGNVLNNAAKYTGRNGQIWLVVETDQGQAVIRVRDNGPGIPEPMLAQVFDMFVQVDSTLVRSHGGLGIGLTLCESLVRMHGGTIEARSEGVGKGSEFIMRLPVLREPKALPAGQLAVRNIVSLPAHRVLVVDDLAASASTLAMVLRRLGQTVETAHDGEAALELVQTFRPDVAFLDIGMPGMDGYELAHRLRQDPALEGLVLVALTGYGQEDDRRQAFDAGFNHHLVKPASMDAIQQLLLTAPTRPALRRAARLAPARRGTLCFARHGA